MKRITINVALQKYRNKQSLYVVKDEIVIESEEIEVDESSVDIDYLLNLIQELPDRYRLVFNLYVLDNFSHKEIANLLEISEGTSKSNLSRARQILKQQIEEYHQIEKEA